MLMCVYLAMFVAATYADRGPCAAKLAEVKARLKSNPYITGLETPRCEADGTFKGMQYGGSQAFCVTPDGKMIDRYMVNSWETGDDMNCNCARDEYEYQKTGMFGVIYYCEENGNYSPIGCTGSVCYCQDKTGKQIGTSTPGIWEMNSLNC